MDDKSFRIGPIRPPSEANSLLIQVTNGCTWNKCKFCNLYRGMKFEPYTVESIKKDIDNIEFLANMIRSGEKPVSLAGEELQCYYMVDNWLAGGGKNVFLQDGNSVALAGGGKLSEVLRYLKEKFPSIERITTYGRAQNLSMVSVEDFIELREAGLDRIHSGFETGSDAVLKPVNKGATQEQQIRAGKNIKAAGIELSIYYMPGLGGKELSDDNAHGTAEVTNACQPDFVRMRTCAVKPGTELYGDMIKGAFTLAGDDDKIREIRRFVEEVDFDGYIVSDHIINLLPAIEGYLGDKTATEGRNSDKDKLLAVIDEYLELPNDERRVYQMLRRTMRASEVAHLSYISEKDISMFKNEVKDISEDMWDEKMNNIIAQYI